ncbi:DedA family protein [Azomonas macrocytogenes]|uniref:Membrane-associated protein n=1 Tax=Azomonas macrocytogenes TaxID=69962 RepID=A0A839T0I0_AZOMA|nr:DedA family protein [Azomonas macrocytogenes]MBB3103077.1 membrane-associated protein [Azomonas macrocytogenes]
MTDLIDIILHLDQHLVEWMAIWGPWIYALMFLIIFCETGLVVTPFLPGDSLLFALGALTTVDDGLSLAILLSSLTLAAILGDASNYHIGKYLGPKVFDRNSRIFRPQYLEQTNAFYEKWGSFTIIAARFAPIVRTFAPFVAGIGSMSYKKFIGYNIIGAFAWVFTFILAGHFFGNLPFVKTNFHIVIFAVIFVSLLPMLAPWIKSRLSRASSTPTD